MTEKVWALTIEHRHGSNVSVHRSEPGAMAALAGYVAEWWGDVPPRVGEMPENSGDAIDAYFDAMSDEFFSLEETELLP